jgi:aryl-alcohol dehydrogenase-like predicted oxidoreductase
VEQGYDVVDAIKPIAQTHSASPAQVAIAWILTKPFISSVIVGANKMHQLEDNLKAADLTLSTSEIQQLDTLTAPSSLYPGWMQALGWDAKVKAAFDPDSKDQ